MDAVREGRLEEEILSLHGRIATLEAQIEDKEALLALADDSHRANHPVIAFSWKATSQAILADEAYANARKAAEQLDKERGE